MYKIRNKLHVKSHCIYIVKYLAISVYELIILKSLFNGDIEHLFSVFDKFDTARFSLFALLLI
jgi:hypothetical protein